MADTRALFTPDLAEVVDEAFERIGLDPADLTGRHILSARRSMNLMLAHWATRGVTDWSLDEQIQPLTAGQTRFDLRPGGFDVLSAVLRRNGVDTPMIALTRDEYADLPSKNLTGLPDRYFVDRNPITPTVYIWQAPERDTDEMRYWLFSQYPDVGGATDRLNMPHFFYEAFVAGLTARLAEKYAPGRLADAYPLAERRLRAALTEDGSRAPLRVGVRYRR